MLKQLLKIFLIIITIFMIFNFLTYSKVEAASTLDDVLSKGDDFLNAADPNTNAIDEGDLQELSGFISGVLLSIAIGVTILSGVILGIKFVTQSIEDKAKIKESMVPWIIGILVSFGAFTIWEIAVNVFQNL